MSTPETALELLATWLDGRTIGLYVVSGLVVGVTTLDDDTNAFRNDTGDERDAMIAWIEERGRR